MKILLLGEYSSLHATLADGLRALGHTVTLASGGDFWKQYPRDIDLRRPSGPLAGLRLWAKIAALMPRFRGYDIVQIINPLFFDLKAERHFRLFRYLKRHNKRIVLGAFGTDYYWVHENITRLPLRYSDFNIGETLRTDPAAQSIISDWTGTPKERLSRFTAENADAIVSCLYEYDACYRHCFPSKTAFIPLPVRLPPAKKRQKNSKIVIFIGISKNRSEYKGTDIMLRAARRIASQYPDLTELVTAEGVPYSDYCSLLDGADIILDQLYSYTPAMNALQAMSRFTVCVGGGEPENYAIIGEQKLRPIVNVLPNEDSVYDALEELVRHPETVTRLQQESRQYVEKHHDHLKVARQYAQLYSRLLAPAP